MLTTDVQATRVTRAIKVVLCQAVRDRRGPLASALVASAEVDLVAHIKPTELVSGLLLRCGAESVVVEVAELTDALFADVRNASDACPEVSFFLLAPEVSRGSRAAVRARLAGVTAYWSWPDSVTQAERQSWVESTVVRRLASGGGEEHGPRARDHTVSPGGQSPVAVAAQAGSVPEALPVRYQRRIDVIAVGASTGGPPALTAFLRGLNPPSVPVVIVQHMPERFLASFAEQLTRTVGARVVLGEHGAELAPGQFWLAPGGQHMRVCRRGGIARLELDDGPPELHCCPSVNQLFRSVAEVYGAAALGVILTGMGEDGLDGCRALAAAAGAVLVQDRASSAIWGMPGVVAEAGLADAVLPPPELAKTAVRRLLVGRTGERRALRELNLGG